MQDHLRGWSLLVLALAAVTVSVSSCKKGGFGDTPLDPSRPPSGLDTSQKQMTDGAGVPGPARARLQTVKPDLNAQIIPGPTGPVVDKCTQSSPFSCFAFLAEVCMDTVSNPTSNSFLAGMRISAVFSSDGINALQRNGRPDEVQPRPNGGNITVAAGSCVTVETPESEKPRYPAEGVPRFFLLVATYGTVAYPVSIDAAACPTLEAIGRIPGPPGPQCALRVAYDLGYHR